MENVAHGAEPDYQQLELGLRVQSLIFSQRWLARGGIQRAFQGKRISKHLQESVQEAVIPSGAFEFAAQGAFRALFLHGVEDHVT
jgi:hypothetical protein